MKSIRRIIRAGLALLLVLCCLCGGVSAALARPTSMTGGYDDTNFVIPGGGVEIPDEPLVIQQEVTLVYFSYPGTVYAGNEGVITARAASFMRRNGNTWSGEYGEFYYTITGIYASVGDKSILAVADTVATDSGWEFSLTGLSAGKTNVTLTIVGSILYGNESQAIQNTETISIEVVGIETPQVYAYAASDEHGTAYPERAAVSENGTVSLSFSAKKGYYIDSILICDAEGTVLKRLTYTQEMVQSKTIELREVYETIYVMLCTASAGSSLKNPFRDLKLEDFENPYTDLNTTDWYYEPVAMMSMAGMLDGIDFEEYLPAEAKQLSARSSAPSYRVTTLTAKTGSASKTPVKRLRPKAYGSRAVTVMQLHNASDNLNLKSGSYTKSPFTDVTTGASCFQAVLWASDKGIVYGYGNGYFGTYDSITREQMCAILLRTAQKCGLALPETTSAKSFTDAASISSWAQSAVAACSKASIVNGFPDGSFKPKNKISNAEIVAMVYRFLNLLP